MRFYLPLQKLRVIEIIFMRHIFLMAHYPSVFSPSTRQWVEMEVVILLIEYRDGWYDCLSLDLWLRSVTG